MAGKPASDSIAIVIGHASHGRSAPSPYIEVMSSSTPASRSRAVITANAAMFISR